VKAEPKFLFKLEDLVPTEDQVQAIEEAAAKKIEKMGLKVMP
jgi:hypothetical protein